MKNKLTAGFAALLMTIGVGMLLTGPVDAAPPRPRTGFESVIIDGTGLNGSQIRTIVYYGNGVARCVHVFEKTTGDLFGRTIANTCPQPDGTRTH